MRLLAFAFISGLVATASAQKVERVSPPLENPFTVPLNIPPVKQPLTSYTDPETGTPIDFYLLAATPFTKKLYPDIPGPGASLVGYDGMEPGPRFLVRKGRETVVRVVNQNYVADGGNGRVTAMHLHGSYSRAPWDGWAQDLIPTGSYKDYYYPNQQDSRTMWYHDHASHLTTLNTYSGLYGIYAVYDPAQEAALNVPRSGSPYDIPLVLNSRFYTATGNISDETAERTSVYGDTLSVNGVIMPYLEVIGRRYRFRILNGAVSKTFRLSLKVEGEDTAVSMFVIGSDSGFVSRVVDTKTLIVGMAERWEIAIDFEAHVGKNLILSTSAIFADTDYEGPEATTLMRFVVTDDAVTDQTGNRDFKDGDALVDLGLSAVDPSRPVDQVFRFERLIGRPWTINGKVFDVAESRILRNVPRGTTEKWVLETPSGWSHPIHIHLVDFQVLSRTITNRAQAPGRVTVERYESVGLKDIIVLGQNERVEVLAKYAPWDGVYMFHCHNNVHEDHDMMAAFNVTSLPRFGYPDTTILTDPMDARFRARPYPGAPDAVQIQRDVLPGFARLKAYGNVALTEQRLDEYWATQGNTGSNTITTTTSRPTTTTSRPTTTSKSTTTSKPTTTNKPTTTKKPTSTRTTTTKKPTTTSKPPATNKPRPDGRCGKAYGGATCDPKGAFGGCCSVHGWCGRSPDHCLKSNGCQFGCTTSPTKPPVSVTKNGRCGKAFGGTICKGWADGECCSQYGWCGKSKDHCKTGCQSGPCLKKN